MKKRKIKTIQFECIQPFSDYEFRITWGTDADSYIEGVDDYVKIKISAETEQKAKKIFKKFIQAIKLRKVRLVRSIIFKK